VQLACLKCQNSMDAALSRANALPLMFLRNREIPGSASYVEPGANGVGGEGGERGVTTFTPSTTFERAVQPSTLRLSTISKDTSQGRQMYCSARLPAGTTRCQTRGITSPTLRALGMPGGHVS
jgi:hypothetical protein